jgi:hypothetical protein
MSYTLSSSSLPAETKFLTRIISDQVCGPTDGTKIITEQQELFPGGIINFDFYGLNEPSVVTKQVLFDVYKLHYGRGATGTKIFNSLGRSLEELCFSLAQIIDIVKNNPKIFSTQALFLTQDKKGNFFLIRVCDITIYSYGSICAFAFTERFPWRASYQFQFVVPQHAIIK